MKGSTVGSVVELASGISENIRLLVLQPWLDVGCENFILTRTIENGLQPIFNKDVQRENSRNNNNNNKGGCDGVSVTKTTTYDASKRMSVTSLYDTLRLVFAVTTYAAASKFSGITLFLRNTKRCSYFSYISIKVFPVCNCTLLPAAAKVWQTLLEAIFCKPFRLFRRVLNDVSSITKRLHFSSDFSRGNR